MAFAIFNRVLAFYYYLNTHIYSLKAKAIIFQDKIVMCVDDYEFRHFSAQREKVCRKFVIVNQDEFARTYFVNISQFQENGKVALCKILMYLGQKGAILEKKQFYVPRFKVILRPTTYCTVSFQGFTPDPLIFRTYPITKDQRQIFKENEEEKQEQMQEQQVQEPYYCRLEEPQISQFYEMMYQKEYSEIIQEQIKKEEEEAQHASEMKDESSQGQSIQSEHKDESSSNNLLNEKKEPKRRKQCERTVRHVIQSVKIWRQLYETKRCNLTKAAKIVGISKKSLDDYYLVIRIGEIHGFDFSQNMDKKMGDLRAFIKDCDVKVTGKLTKEVKCFDLVPHFNLDKIMQQASISNITQAQ